MPVRPALVRIAIALSVVAALSGGGFVSRVSAVPPFAPRSGEVTGDTGVNSFDALHVLFYGAGLSGRQTQAWQDAADVNGDGVANSLDASFILQFHAGLLSHLPP